MSRFRVALLFLSLASSCQAEKPIANRPWLNSDLGMEQRIDLLLSKMTLQEKIDQLDQPVSARDSTSVVNENNDESNLLKSGHVPGSYLFRSQRPEYRNQLQKRAVTGTRLGIPIIFGYDIIHGCRVVGPAPLNQSWTFDPKISEQVCRVAAIESSRMGIDWTFAPMVDVSRDPRWGRITESFGECPLTNAVFGAASVRGFQGDSIDDLKRPDTIAACLKHFTAYGASQAGKDYHATEVPPVELFNVYMEPFKVGVDAGACTLMCAFNDLNGVPTSANHFTETEVLRNRWGFDGFIVSDWNSVEQLCLQGFAEDSAQAAELALNAGTDMNMKDNAYRAHLAKLVQNGKVSEDTIDTAVKRILRIKFRLGLFERPYTEILPKEERYYAKEHLDAVRTAAQESLVLLKNENKTLPLASERITRIALIGPASDRPTSMLGPWAGHGETDKTITLKTALQRRFGDQIEIVHENVTNLETPNGWLDRAALRRAVKAAANADVTILCLGENGGKSSENYSVAQLKLYGQQDWLCSEISKRSKKLVTLLFACRPHIVNGIVRQSDAFLLTGFPGSEGANAVLDVVFGDVAPSGKLTVSFPRHVGQIPIHYNRRPKARDGVEGEYHDMDTNPLFTFGDGLSYTSFKYSDLTLSNNSVAKDGKLTATVTVTNTGQVAAKESVLWFINDPVASITRPRKELKHFEKKEIQPGESIKYKFHIVPSEHLSFYDREGRRVLDSGKIVLFAGNQQTSFAVE